MCYDIMKCDASHLEKLKRWLAADIESLEPTRLNPRRRVREIQYIDRRDVLKTCQQITVTYVDSVFRTRLQKEMSACFDRSYDPDDSGGYGAALSVAPRAQASRVVGCGRIHRDAEYKYGQCYTAFYCLDDIKVLPERKGTNGAVKIWENSEKVSLRPRDPSRCVQHLKEHIITAKAGDLVVFKSATLHQSLPNTSFASRAILVWFICRCPCQVPCNHQ